jgi:hypothetical protein
MAPNQARGNSMIRNSLAVLGLAALLAIPGTRALAAPTNSPTSSTFPVQCGDQTFIVTLNSGQAGNKGNQNATQYDPAFIVGGGSGLGIPLTISGVVVDANGNVLGSFSSTKGNAQAKGLPQETCTFTQSDGGITFNGTVTIALNTHANTAH